MTGVTTTAEPPPDSLADQIDLLDMQVVVSEDALSFVYRGCVCSHISRQQFRILAAIRDHDLRRRALASIAFNLRRTRSERRLSGEQLTPSQRASLSRCVRRLIEQDLLRVDEDAWICSTDRGKSIVDLMRDDNIAKRECNRALGRKLGVSRDEFRRLTRRG